MTEGRRSHLQQVQRPETDRSATIDRGRVEAAVRELLVAIGEDPDRDGLVRTPARVADMFTEIYGRPVQVRTGGAVS